MTLVSVGCWYQPGWD